MKTIALHNGAFHWLIDNWSNDQTRCTIFGQKVTFTDIRFRADARPASLRGKKIGNPDIINIPEATFDGDEHFARRREGIRLERATTFTTRIA